MNYKLAKQLREAGTDQHFDTKKGRRYWMYDKSDDDYVQIVHDGNIDNALDDEQLFYTPSLSELIDACGMEFWILENLNNGMWVAKAIDREGKEILIKSKTPKEAAAKLYIKLNK